MTETEFLKITHLCDQYKRLKIRLAQIDQIVEDLKFEKGTLRMDIGGGRATFQTIDESTFGNIRPTLIEFFRNEARRLRCEIGDLK